MAPPVVVYVVVAVSVVGAALAFKEFVYEPHIAPRVERWAEDFVNKRKAKKAAKQRTREAVPVGVRPGSSAGTETGKGGEGRRSMTVTDLDTKNTYELETMVAQEVSQWREQVQVRSEGVSTLRQRRPASALDESNVILPYDPMEPTHVLFDDSLSVSSPGSSISSRVPTPLSNSTLSNQSFRTPPPPPPVAFQAPPTPDPSVHASSPVPDNPFEDGSDLFSSPAHVPSLSLSHPVDLAADAEHDLELLSAPSSSAPSDSSRPVSPSAFSESAFSTTDEQVFHSFTMSPSMMLGAASIGPSFPASPAVNSLGMSSGSEIGDDELDRWSNAGSDSIGSESSWTSAGSPAIRGFFGLNIKCIIDRSTLADTPLATVFLSATVFP
ncbi:hypothetical protein MIND_01429000 [Mycena indigotica]|uniref:Uncharacterized protein n=1 Tax=Mycena indigotica TaxID=2126181 RepID=A0A8H6RXQ8_9AGAR|nr:uncharacterized protein MIND_01429000 [Mycena indigotica]KAF7288623.1 hypothetical protein MIND_01429000 [Mycena indigotica]